MDYFRHELKDWWHDDLRNKNTTFNQLPDHLMKKTYDSRESKSLRTLKKTASMPQDHSNHEFESREYMFDSYRKESPSRVSPLRESPRKESPRKESPRKEYKPAENKYDN